MHCAETFRLLAAYGNAVTLAVNAKAEFRAADVASEGDFIHLIAVLGEAILACQGAEAAVRQHVTQHQCLGDITPEGLFFRVEQTPAFDPNLPNRDPEPDDPETPGPNPDEPGPDVNNPDIDPDQDPMPLRLNSIDVPETGPPSFA